MRAVYCRMERFQALPVARVWPQAPDNPAPVEVTAAVVVYLALEEGDDTRQEALAEALVQAAGRLDPALPLVLHSFNHLTARPLKARTAARLYAHLAEAVQARRAAPVLATAFGWTHRLRLEDDGTPGSKGLLLVPAASS